MIEPRVSVPDRKADQTGRRRRARAGRRAAGPLFGVPGVSRAAPEPAIPGRQRTHGQLGDKDGPGVPQPAVDGGVGVDRPVLVGRGPPGGPGPAHGQQVLGAPGDPVERPPIGAGGNLLVGLPRLTAGQLLGEAHHTAQGRVVLLQTREIELGQLGRPDLSGLHQPGEMAQREKRQVRIGRRHRDRDLLTPHRAAVDGQRHPGRDRVKHERGLGAVAQVGGTQRLVVRRVATRTVEPTRDRLQLVRGEAQPGDSLGRLEHLDGDLVGILRDRGECAGHQGRPDPGRGQTDNEAPAVHRELLLIHRVPPPQARPKPEVEQENGEAHRLLLSPASWRSPSAASPPRPHGTRH